MLTLHFSRISGEFALWKLTDKDAPVAIAMGPAPGNDPKGAVLDIAGANDVALQRAPSHLKLV